MLAGTVKTSSILVATADRTEVYRTLQEMPFSLRRRIVRLASGPNAATLLIADQKGVEEWLSAHGRAKAERSEERRRWAGRLWLALAGSGLVTFVLWALGLVRP
jgi:hypothetical protein